MKNIWSKKLILILLGIIFFPIFVFAVDVEGNGQTVTWTVPTEINFDSSGQAEVTTSFTNTNPSKQKYSSLRFIDSEPYLKNSSDNSATIGYTVSDSENTITSGSEILYDISGNKTLHFQLEDFSNKKPGEYSGSVTFELTITNVPLYVETVSISGTKEVGYTLTATVTPSEATGSYQWYRDNTSVDGATSSTYALTTADRGHTIKCTFTGSGEYLESATSNPTSVIKERITSVSVSGTAKVGQTLTATVSPTGATGSYQWYRGSTPISGATGSTYTLTSDDRNKAIKCTFTGNGNYVGSATSSPTASVTEENPMTVTAPTAANKTYNGSAQTIANAGSTSLGTMYYGLGSSTTSGPSSWSTSLPSATDPGTYYIWYKVTGDSNHNDIAPTYAASATISKISITSVSVSGIAKVGQTLTATPSPSDATVSYQWKRGDTSISSATSSTYTLVEADRGSTIKCTVTGTGNYTGSATSTPTSAVVQDFTIILVPDGGTLSSTSITYTTGTAKTLPTPTRDGHTFVGWFTSRATDTSLPGTAVLQVGANETGDKTFYAVWREDRVSYSGTYTYESETYYAGTSTNNDEAHNAAYWPQALGLATGGTNTPNNPSIASISAYGTRSGYAGDALNGLGFLWYDQVNTVSNGSYIDINLASGYSFKVTSVKFSQQKMDHEKHNRWTVYGNKSTSLATSDANTFNTKSVSNNTYWTSFRIQETTKNGEGCLSEIYFAGYLKYQATDTVTNSTSNVAPNNGTWSSGYPTSTIQYRYSTGESTYTDWDDITLTINDADDVGQTLTATTTPSGLTGSYQWYRDDTAISGASSSTYTTVEADSGHSIKCKFTILSSATISGTIITSNEATILNSI